MRWSAFRRSHPYKGRRSHPCEAGSSRGNAIYNLYNIALSGVFIFGSPFFLYKIIRGKYRAGIRDRFGFLPKRIQNKKSKRIWIHAVSVGEVGAALPIINEIRKLAPQIDIYMTTTTSTGQEVAKKRLGKNVFYYPLDFPWCVRHALKIIQPDIFTVMETEIWPNMFRYAKRSGAKIAILNARISNNSFKGYNKIKFLLGQVFFNVDFFGAQTEEDRDRYKKLGVGEDKISVTGNSKFDVAAVDMNVNKLGYFKSLMASEGKKVIVFGSTHHGEEEIILSVCKSVSDKFPRHRFILCPRHPERAQGVLELARGASFKTVRRSELNENRRASDEDFIILDSIGELATIYGLADIVFMGGSLVQRGGQNMIEPAYWGKPIIFGPHTFNFRKIVRVFLENNAACEIKNGKGLEAKLLYFLDNKEKAEGMGRRARAIIEFNRGSSKKSAEMLSEFF